MKRIRCSFIVRPACSSYPRSPNAAVPLDHNLLGVPLTRWSPNARQCGLLTVVTCIHCQPERHSLYNTTCPCVTADKDHFQQVGVDVFAANIANLLVSCLQSCLPIVSEGFGTVHWSFPFPCGEIMASDRYSNFIFRHRSILDVALYYLPHVVGWDP